MNCLNAVDVGVLDALCPMHLILASDGEIRHAGPTISKIFEETDLIGMQFLEAFNVCRPRRIEAFADLEQINGAKLHLLTRNRHETEMKGQMVRTSCGFMVNLSFGISIVEGVRDYRLTNHDFAVTDLAIELLYLVEAKSAAMEESRKLNLRLQGAKFAAEEQALTDTLTGLKNRRAMDHELERMALTGAPFAVMHIDLDYFKTVNDTLGHAAGDHVLRVVSKAMQEEVRDGDIVARVGGDEFTVILPNVANPSALEGIGARIIERLEVPIPFGEDLCRVSGSIGTVWVPKNGGADVDEVLGNADVALYASKHAGRGQQTFYRPELCKAPDFKEMPAGRSRAGQSNFASTRSNA